MMESQEGCTLRMIGQLLGGRNGSKTKTLIELTSPSFFQKIVLFRHSLDPLPQPRTTQNEQHGWWEWLGGLE